VHQLPEYAAEGHPPTFEYPLPVDVGRPAFAAVHPWLRGIASLDPDDARVSLAARWDGLRSDSLLRIRDYLLDCEATSLVLTGPRAWILCVDQHKAMNLVAPPVDYDVISRQRSQWHLDDYPLLIELLTSFGGLREDFAPAGGYFIDGENWSGVTESWMEVIEGYSEWKGALIIFSSRGGDKLLLDRTGRVGWWVADEVRMREAYPDLEACLLDFVRYRCVPWPFAPYEPPLSFPRVFG
jgi:hypothetical protein